MVMLKDILPTWRATAWKLASLSKVAASGNVFKFLLILILAACHKPFVPLQAPDQRADIFTDGLDYGRTNYYPLKTDTAFKLVDEESINGQPAPTLCLIGDYLAFPTRNGYLFTVSAADLGNNQNIRISKGLAAAATYDNGQLFVASEKGKYGLVAYDLSARSERWKISPYFSVSSPVISAGRAYHATIDGRVLCLLAASGEIIWDKKIAGSIKSNLAADRDGLFLSSPEGMVKNIRFEDGSVGWQKQLGHVLLTQPLLSSGRLFLAAYAGKIFVLEANSGNTVQQKDIGVNLYQPLSSDGHMLIIPRSDGLLEAVETGDIEHQIWQRQLDGPPSTAALITRSHVLIGTAQRKLYFINKTTGQTDKIFDLDGRLCALPVFWQKRMIIGFEYKGLAAYQIRDRGYNAASK